jgi:3-hydroxyacyl-CoA dehydrogenase
MGPGISLAFAVGGCPVVMMGLDRKLADQGQADFRDALARLVENGFIDELTAQGAAGRLRTATDLDCVTEADVVIEATPEIVASKQEVFARLEALARPEAILASNTSGLPITQIAAKLRTPHRVVGMKFVIPAYLIPLVEVVKGEATSLETLEKACDLLWKIGKRPVRVMHDVPGFLNNRIQQAMRREAISLVARGVATAEDVDAAVRWGFGFRLLGAGTLETMDLVGLEQLLRINEYITPDLDPPSDPPALLRDLIGKGKTGAKAGEGFLKWDPDRVREANRRQEAMLIGALKLARQVEMQNKDPR